MVTSRNIERSVGDWLAERRGHTSVDMGHSYAVLLAGLFAIAAGLVGSVALMKRMVLASDCYLAPGASRTRISLFSQGQPTGWRGSNSISWERSSFGLQRKTGTGDRRCDRRGIRRMSRNRRARHPQRICWKPSLVISRSCHWSVSFLGRQPSFCCRLPRWHEGSIDPGIFFPRSWLLQPE